MDDQLAEIQKLLGSLLGEVKASKVSLGFQESVMTPIYLNSVKCPGHVWYQVKDGEQQIPIKEQAFTGYLLRMERVTATRRDKDTEKLHLWMEGDEGGLYRFECGWGRQTFKSLVAAIAFLTPDQVRQPITLFPYTGKDASVLFVKLYVDRKSVFAPYGLDSDWDALWDTAVHLLSTVNAPDTLADIQEVEVSDPLDSAPIAPAPDVTPVGTGVIDQIKTTLSECQTIDDLVALGFWLHDSTEGEALREVPQSYQWVLDKIREQANATSCSIADVLAGTDVEMRRLGWDAKRGREHLAKTYGRRSRQDLHEGQLIDFLGYLKVQPNTLLSPSSF